MAYGCSKLTALLLLYSVFIVLYLPEYFKEKMQEYIMHNYKQNIHIGDVKSIKSKRRAVNGEDEVQEICEVVEENGISMKIVL